MLSVCSVVDFPFFDSLKQSLAGGLLVLRGWAFLFSEGGRGAYSWGGRDVWAGPLMKGCR